MDIKTFQNLPEFKDIGLLKNPKKGMMFLYGNAMIEQKFKVDVGKIVSYYIINEVKPNNNIVYQCKYDKITNDRKN